LRIAPLDFRRPGIVNAGINVETCDQAFDQAPAFFRGQLQGLSLKCFDG
jgi:hypothetical protein